MGAVSFNQLPDIHVTTNVMFFSRRLTIPPPLSKRFAYGPHQRYDLSIFVTLNFISSNWFIYRVYVFLSNNKKINKISGVDALRLRRAVIAIASGKN